jgi:hypothetical protein
VALKKNRARLAGAALAALAVGVATLAATGPAQGLNTSKIGGPDDATFATGFPTHYTDDFGTSLRLCVDGTVKCGNAVPTDVDLASAPDGEAFYWMATADIKLSPTKAISVEFAHEAAWANATDRMVFDRTRIRGDLKPGRYTLLTPYGKTRFSAVGTGQRNVNLTKDPTCVLEPAARGRCSAKMTNWLRSTSAPVGYLGNGVRATTVKGGTFRNNLVLLNGKGKAIARTDKFVVTGLLADGGAATLSTGAVMFGNTSKVVHKSIMLKNQGNAPLSLQGIRLTGAKTLTLSKTGCAARASLASGATCPINITYRPGLHRPSSATLSINDNTIAGIHKVPVKTGTPR